MQMEQKPQVIQSKQWNGNSDDKTQHLDECYFNNNNKKKSQSVAVKLNFFIRVFQKCCNDITLCAYMCLCKAGVENDNLE